MLGQNRKPPELKQYLSYGHILDQINRPSIQRSIDQTRVDAMKKHILERKLKDLEPIFGCIILVKMNSELYVIDGQHRLTALEQVYKEKKINVIINCMIYHVNSNGEMKEIFETLNMGVPVPEFIISCHDKRKLLEEIDSYLAKTGGLFDRYKTNRPVINIPKFVEALAHSKLFTHINNLQDFKTILAEINHLTMEKYSYEHNCKRDGVSSNMRIKCSEKDLWIGLDKNYSWFEDGYDIRSLVAKLKINIPLIVLT